MARYYTLTYELPHEMDSEEEALEYVRNHMWNEPTIVEYEEDDEDDI